MYDFVLLLIECNVHKVLFLVCSVKEAGKDASYTVVILAGLAVTGNYVQWCV